MAKMLQQEQIISSLRAKNTNLQTELDRVVEDNELYYQKMKELERAKSNLWRDFQVVKQAALLRRDQLIRTTRELMRVRQAKLKLAEDLRSMMEELDMMKSEGGELDSDSDNDDHHDYPFQPPRKKKKAKSLKSNSSQATFISKSSRTSSSSRGKTSLHLGGTSSLPSSRRQSYADGASRRIKKSTPSKGKVRRSSAAPRGRRRSIGEKTISSASSNASDTTQSTTHTVSGRTFNLFKLPKKRPPDLSQRVWLGLQKKASQARRAAIQAEKRRKAQNMKLKRQHNKTIVEREKQMEERRKRGMVQKFKHATHSKLIGRMIDKQEKRNAIADMASAERQRIKEKIERDVARDVEFKRNKIAVFLQDVDNRIEDRLDLKIRTRDEVAMAATVRREALKAKIDKERQVEQASLRQKATETKELFEQRLKEIQAEEQKRVQEIIEASAKRREAIKHEIEINVERDMDSKSARVAKFKQEMQDSFTAIREEMQQRRDAVAQERLQEKQLLERRIEEQRIEEIRTKRDQAQQMRLKDKERQKEIEYEFARRREAIALEAQLRKDEIAAKIEQIVEKDLQKKRALVTAHKDSTVTSAEERGRMMQEERDAIAAAAVDERLALEAELARISDEELAKNRELVNMQKALQAEKERERIELYKQLLTDLDEDFIQYTPKNALEIARAIEELQENRINNALQSPYQRPGSAVGGMMHAMGGMNGMGPGFDGMPGMSGGIGYGNGLLGIEGADPLLYVDGLGPGMPRQPGEMDNDVSLFDTRRLQRGNSKASPRHANVQYPRKRLAGRQTTERPKSRRSSARPRGSPKKARRRSTNRARAGSRAGAKHLKVPGESARPTTPTSSPAKKKSHHKRNSTLTKLEQLKAKLEGHKKSNDEGKKSLLAQKHGASS